MPKYDPNFLSQLDFTCTETIEPPKYIRTGPKINQMHDMEQKITNCLGMDFLTEFERLQIDMHEWEVEAHFLAGLRFGFQFAQLIHPD